MDDLLVFEGRITVPATAPQYFPQEGTARYPSQKIVWPISRMSDDVSTVFFEGPWVQECTVDEQTLRFYRVLRSTKCSIFLALLGEHAETTFSEMLAFLKMQKRMQGGVLARSDVKVFLIRDLSHALRFVFASWHKKGGASGRARWICRLHTWVEIRTASFPQYQQWVWSITSLPNVRMSTLYTLRMYHHAKGIFISKRMYVSEARLFDTGKKCCII